MPLPAFTIDGVIPPFVGANGPGGAAADMSPFPVSLAELVVQLGHTPERRAILRDWLQHRSELHGLGFVEGFQWLDGSFVEDKVPGDLDFVTFFKRPAASSTDLAISGLFLRHPHVFRRPVLRQRLKLDAMFVDLNGSPEQIVEATRYYGGLFSHRRGDGLWKGMLRVPLDGNQDGGAVALLDQMDAQAVALIPQAVAAQPADGVNGPEIPGEAV